MKREDESERPTTDAEDEGLVLGRGRRYADGQPYESREEFGRHGTHDAMIGVEKLGNKPSEPKRHVDY